MDASIGMNGAGRFGSQCGLVEGVLMFIGIYSIHKGIQKEKIINLCNNFSKGFQQNFGSLLCRELRPQRFSSGNPLHLCEDIIKRAVSYSAEFIAKSINVIIDITASRITGYSKIYGTATLDNPWRILLLLLLIRIWPLSWSCEAGKGTVRIIYAFLCAFHGKKAFIIPDNSKYYPLN